jgi:hypothetical protein
MCVGDVSGELVYVNYGRVEDIEELQKLQVNLTGIGPMENFKYCWRASSEVKEQWRTLKS